MSTGWRREGATRLTRGRFIASAAVALFYAAAFAARLFARLSFEIGDFSPGAISGGLAIVIHLLLAVLFIAGAAGIETPRLTILGVVVFAFLSGFQIWRLVVPFRYVIFGRLWPAGGTDVEVLVDLTIFAVHWNAWLVSRRERVD